MANNILTLSMITRKAIALFHNSNAFLQVVDKQYDSNFAKSGGKIGSSLQIRLPNDYTVRAGATASVSDTREQQRTLTVAVQKGVDVSFSSSELALSMDDFSSRVLSPMVNKLAGAVAYDLMNGVVAGSTLNGVAVPGLADQVPNIVSTFASDGSTLASPTASSWLLAGAILDQMSAPRGDRRAVIDPLTQARTVSSLSGLFNPTTSIGDQYKVGQMGGTGGALGIQDWRMDQTVLLHQTAAYGATNTNGTSTAGGTVITCASLNGGLNAGDIITVAGVYGVNRVTGQSTGVLQQFVVTSAAAATATSINVYPALVVAPAAYATIDSAVTTGKAINVLPKASAQYRKNLVFVKEAFTMVTADLDLPTGAVVDVAREQYDGVSLRMLRDYNSTADTWLTRLDILYGFAAPRPEWAVIVADIA